SSRSMCVQNAPGSSRERSSTRMPESGSGWSDTACYYRRSPRLAPLGAPMTESTGRTPSLAVSLIPIGVLIALLASSVALFGDASSSGPNQIALILAAGAGIIIGVAHGQPWKVLESGIVCGISLAMGAILILLVVGALIGSWILAGIVPTMIYYGLQLLSPAIFFPSACALCCLVALATGSSWTTAGTVGVALIGIAAAQDLSL